MYHMIGLFKIAYGKFVFIKIKYSYELNQTYNYNHNNLQLGRGSITNVRPGQKKLEIVSMCV